jgi:hypothetical protein
VFILSFPVRLEPFDTLVKHNVLLGYDAYGYDYGFYARCVRGTYAAARFGELPFLSVPSKTDSRAAHAFPEGPKGSLNKVD